jgi:SAM-dependent methyltransferase
LSNWWHYDNLPSLEPYRWDHTNRGTNPYDNIDFHLDIGAGTLKKGRLGIDRHLAPGVDVVMDLENLVPVVLPVEQGVEHLPTAQLYEEAVLSGWLPDGTGLPFPDNSIESIISHHCMEHLLWGFLPLMDECHRVLKPGGVLRIITPLFPSRTAMEDPDHKRLILEGTFDTFVGNPDGSHWHEDFSVPYTKCRFEMVDKDVTAILPPEKRWGPEDAREIRVALRKRDL